jgi:hypothetical protein
VLVGAGAVMFAASQLHGLGLGFRDAGTVATGLKTASGSTAGAVFAVVLFNASILGAAAVTLASAYAIGDYAGLKHPLHRKPGRPGVLRRLRRGRIDRRRNRPDPPCPTFSVRGPTHGG